MNKFMADIDKSRSCVKTAGGNWVKFQEGFAVRTFGKNHFAIGYNDEVDCSDGKIGPRMACVAGWTNVVPLYQSLLSPRGKIPERKYPVPADFETWTPHA